MVVVAGRGLQVLILHLNQDLEQSRLAGKNILGFVLAVYLMKLR